MARFRLPSRLALLEVSQAFNPGVGQHISLADLLQLAGLDGQRFATRSERGNSFGNGCAPTQGEQARGFVVGIEVHRGLAVNGGGETHLPVLAINIVNLASNDPAPGESIEPCGANVARREAECFSELDSFSLAVPALR